MKLENQVTSLEISKKLKSLNLNQESLFYWHTHDGKNWELDHRNFDHRTVPIEFEICSAFTVAELGEMLKNNADFSNISYTKELDEEGNWQYQTIGTNECPLGIIGHEPTEADARGKMLIYLIENNLIQIQI